MSKIYTSIDQLIGNTPLLKLNRIVPEDAADVYVKLEFFNPAGSIKDRIALSMIEKAESRRQAQTWRHDHRTNFRQHWDWTGQRSSCQGLPPDYRHARNDER